MTRQLRTIYRDICKKRSSTRATYYTAEPLYVRFHCNTMTSNAQARVWQLATATPDAAAKHMLFYLSGLRKQDN